MNNIWNYYQLIPIKIMELIPSLDSSFKHIPGYSSDNMKQIISEISFHVREEKIKKGISDDHNCNLAHLKMKYLRNLVPQADQYLVILRKLGIVSRFGTPIKGVKSFMYGFTKEYESKYLRIQLTNPKLLIRITKFQKNMKKRNPKMYPGQNQFLRDLTIQGEALEFIKLFENEKEYNYALSSVTRILNGEIFFSVDATSKRYHSNLTNMPKELRQFVRINGKQLINLDVKNCQPYLSILLLTKPKKVVKFSKYVNFAMVLESLQINKTEDVVRYISLVTNGGIYEYLIEEFERNGVGSFSRDETKKIFLQVLFDDNSHNSKARKVFQRLFPEVHRVFCLIRGNEKGDSFKNFKRFAILLQRIESHIILSLVLNRINKEHPGVIAVTIHDSIMTSIYTDDVEKVKKIMIDEFSKFIGFEPKIEVER